MPENYYKTWSIRKINLAMDKNLENNIKYHFENRRINPDATAWSKLDSSLSQSEKRTPSIYRLNLKVSAAAVALILFGLFLLNHLLVPADKEEIISANTEVEVKTEISPSPGTGDKHILIVDNTENSKKKPSKIVATTTSTIEMDNTHTEKIKQYQVSFSNETDIPENNAELSQQAIQEITKHHQQEEFTDFKMVDPQKLLSDTEIVLTLKSKQDMVNKYDIDPNKLLKEAEKEANRSYLLKAIKSVKEISSPMISAVMSRNEIKAE
jgi:hypothetical protein